MSPRSPVNTLKLREFGKHVIGLGAETSASARLVSVCSKYKLWGSIVARVEPRWRQTRQVNRPPSRGSRLADAEQLLVTAMEQITADTPTAAQVKNKMVQLDASFDVANYGCRSFRDFLGKFGHRVRTAGRSGQDITLALIVPSPSPNGGTAKAIPDPGPAAAGPGLPR